MARLASAIPTSANDGDMSIPFILTTLQEDRDGDIVVPMGCQLDEYELNPVIFFGHQQHPIPIATAKSPDGRLAVYPEENLIRGVAYFDKEDADAAFIYGKVKRGYLNATSIAFVPIQAIRRDAEREKSVVDRGHQHSQPGAPAGWIFKQYSLTEWSIVGVPSNAGAIRDTLDSEKAYISPKLQKAMVPYAAKAVGRCFSGWCKSPGGVCVPCEKSIAKEPPVKKNLCGCKDAKVGSACGCKNKSVAKSATLQQVRDILTRAGVADFNLRDDGSSIRVGTHAADYPDEAANAAYQALRAANLDVKSGSGPVVNVQKSAKKQIRNTVKKVDSSVYERILSAIPSGGAKRVGGKLVKRGVKGQDERFADTSNAYTIDGGDWMTLQSAATKLATEKSFIGHVTKDDIPNIGTPGWESKLPFLRSPGDIAVLEQQCATELANWRREVQAFHSLNHADGTRDISARQRARARLEAAFNALKNAYLRVAKSHKKSLLESSGSAGGYTVAVENVTDAASPQGDIVCVQCTGDGNCAACGGVGETGGNACQSCDGSGACSMCSGAGKTQKQLKGRGIVTRKGVYVDQVVVILDGKYAGQSGKVESFDGPKPEVRMPDGSLVEFNERQLKIKGHTMPTKKSTRKIAAKKSTRKKAYVEEDHVGNLVVLRERPGNKYYVNSANEIDQDHHLAGPFQSQEQAFNWARSNAKSAKRVRRKSAATIEVAPKNVAAFKREAASDGLTATYVRDVGQGLRQTELWRVEGHQSEIDSLSLKYRAKSITKSADEVVEEVEAIDEDKGIDDSNEMPFTPKPSALEAAKAYQHLKDLADYYGPGGDGDLEKMDHPGMSEALKDFLEDDVPKAMEKIKSSILTHHKSDEDPEVFMEKLCKALGGADEFETGEAGMVENGDIPPEVEEDSFEEEVVEEDLLDEEEVDGELEEKSGGDCPFCNGTGSNPGHGGPCNACDGTGDKPDSAKSEVGSEEWAEEEANEPEHKEEVIAEEEEEEENIDPDTEEILERYQHPKSGRWMTRKVGVARRAKDGRVYVTRRKDLTDPGSEDGAGKPMRNEGNPEELKAEQGAKVGDRVSSESNPSRAGKIVYRTGNDCVVQFDDGKTETLPAYSLMYAKSFGDDVTDVEMDLDNEGNPEELKAEQGAKVGDRVASESNPTRPGKIVYRTGNDCVVQFDDGKTETLPAYSLMYAKSRKSAKPRPVSPSVERAFNDLKKTLAQRMRINLNGNHR